MPVKLVSASLVVLSSINKSIINAAVKQGVNLSRFVLLFNAADLFDRLGFKLTCTASMRDVISGLNSGPVLKTKSANEIF